MEQVLKNFFLFLSKNQTMTRLARKYGPRFGAARFVAGETIDDAVQVMKELHFKGLTATVDYLGEFVDNEKEAIERVEHMIAAIKRIEEEKLCSQFSLKLSAMGLNLSDQLAMDNMRRILAAAKESDVFVTIDMEDYVHYRKTLAIFKMLKKEYENVGTVLQAYLYCVLNDAEELKEYAPNLRLVKGAYKESADVAFPNKKDVDENYKKLIKMHLLNGNYTAIATHDESIIEYAKGLVKKYNLSNDQFEFQMLYGIRAERQLELANEGYRMRVYVPFGTDWYGYFMRRLAERPANAAFAIKGIFKK